MADPTVLYSIDVINRALPAVMLAAVAGAATVNWPSFRGPEAGGVADGKVATSWNADPGAGALRNIRWKTPIPGLAHSSPAIWENRLFVTSAISSAGPAPLKVGLYGEGDPADDNAEQNWGVYRLGKKTGTNLRPGVTPKSGP